MRGMNTKNSQAPLKKNNAKDINTNNYKQRLRLLTNLNERNDSFYKVSKFHLNVMLIGP